MTGKRKEGRAPEPVVVGARYCVRCGRLCLASAISVGSAMPMASVGAAASGCCMAKAVVLLVPVDRPVDDLPLPAALPQATLDALAGRGEQVKPR